MELNHVSFILIFSQVGNLTGGGGRGGALLSWGSLLYGVILSPLYVSFSLPLYFAHVIHMKYIFQNHPPPLIFIPLLCICLIFLKPLIFILLQHIRVLLVCLLLFCCRPLLFIRILFVLSSVIVIDWYVRQFGSKCHFVKQHDSLS